MKEKDIGGNGKVVVAYWNNNTGNTVRLTITVSAKQVPMVNNYYEVRACVNTDFDEWEGIVLSCTASSTSYFDTRTATIDVPNGYNLMLWNNNDAYSIWTVTYN